MRHAALNKSLIASWANLRDVDNCTLCFLKPQLILKFRFIETSGSLHRTNYVCNDRWDRETIGNAVLYQAVTQNNIFAPKRKFAFKNSTVGWSGIPLKESL